MNKFSKGKKILFIVLIVPVLIAIFGYVVMQLWNWLIPDLFNGPTITFWQTLGLLLLSKILFGGFKCGPQGHKKWDKRSERFKHMSREEKEAFKKKWSEKWRWGCPEMQEETQEKSSQEKE